MKRMCFAALCCVFGLAVAFGCGGGGGGGNDGPPVSLTTVMASLEDNYLDLNGDEYTFGPVSGTGYNVSLLGYAACMPADGFTDQILMNTIMMVRLQFAGIVLRAIQ